MAKIALIGDIGLFGRHRAVDDTWRTRFSEVSRILAGHDVVIGNLETPMTTAEKRYGGKSAYIKAAPVDVEVLKYLNVSCVSLANNHIMDFGLAGLDETIATLEGANVMWFGVRGKALDLHVQGEDILVFGYCGLDTNPEGILRGRINHLSVGRVRESLRRAECEKKFPILSVHYGTEHRSFPSAQDVGVFRHLAHEHNFVLHGHHSHALQPTEMYRQSLLAYSLGNFCFDDVVDPDTGQMLLEMRATGRVGGIITVVIGECRIRAWSACAVYDNGSSMQVDAPSAAERLYWVQELFGRDPAAALKYGDEQRRAFLRERKAARDASFYLRRLKPRYVRMFFFMGLNRLMARYLRGARRPTHAASAERADG